MGIKSCEFPKVISIIGLGSLGGFIARQLYYSVIDFNNLILIDFDKVNKKNLNNSIYEKGDIGKFKTSALFQKLIYAGNRKKIITITDQYVGNNINFSNSDLVIDCRDIFSGYDENISFKTYITGTDLIIDCSKPIDNNIYDGNYIYELDKLIIYHAAEIVVQLILSKLVYKLIENRSIYKFDIQYLDKVVNNQIIPNYNNNNNNNNNNVVIDDSPIFKKFRNLIDVEEKIIKSNKIAPIYIKSNTNNFNKIVPQNSLKTINDLLPILKPIILDPFSYSSYILDVEDKQMVKKDNNNCIIINIISASGGA